VVDGGTGGDDELEQTENRLPGRKVRVRFPNDFEDPLPILIDVGKQIADLDPLAQLLASSDIDALLGLAEGGSIAVTVDLALGSGYAKRVRPEPVTANPLVDRELELLDSLVRLRQEGEGGE
jgi:hypothetical protein